MMSRRIAILTSVIVPCSESRQAIGGGAAGETLLFGDECRDTTMERNYKTMHLKKY